MGLSCSCSEWDGDGETYWAKDDISILNSGKYSKRCKSCGIKIKQGEHVLEFKRGRGIENDIEERIYGDEMKPLASVYHCAKCGEIYLNLESLGYCQDYTDNMSELLKEHQRISNHGGWFKG